jgi:hypothetical protein
MAVDQISATKVRHSLDLAQLLLVCHDVAVFLEDNRRCLLHIYYESHFFLRYCPEVIGFLLNTLMIANEVDKHENLLSNFPAKQNFLHFEEKVIIFSSSNKLDVFRAQLRKLRRCQLRC